MVSTSYAYNMEARRKSLTPPSFYESIFYAYAEMRFALKSGLIDRAHKLLVEYDKTHRLNRDYWQYRREIVPYFEEAYAAPVPMVKAA